MRVHRQARHGQKEVEGWRSKMEQAGEVDSSLQNQSCSQVEACSGCQASRPCGTKPASMEKGKEGRFQVQGKYKAEKAQMKLSKK